MTTACGAVILAICPAKTCKASPASVRSNPWVRRILRSSSRARTRRPSGGTLDRVSLTAGIRPPVLATDRNASRSSHRAWTISDHADAVAVLIVVANRAFARRLDGVAGPIPIVCTIFRTQSLEELFFLGTIVASIQVASCKNARNFACDGGEEQLPDIFKILQSECSRSHAATKRGKKVGLTSQALSGE